MAHIRNNCLKENTLQVEINQQCQDISNISGNDCCGELVDGIDNVFNQIEDCCDTLSDKLDKIDSKLKPIIIYKPVYIKDYIEIRTTKYVYVKIGNTLPPNKIEIINYGPVKPQNGWEIYEKISGWWIKYGKFGRNYYKLAGTPDSQMLSEIDFFNLFNIKFSRREILIEGKNRIKYYKTNLSNKSNFKENQNFSTILTKWVELSPGRWSPQ